MRDPASWYIRTELQALVADFAKNPKPLNALVVGPPGSGKTTVVRQAASNACVELLEIPASVLASDSPETIEAQLQAIFIKAARASCVLFLDDIDYWLPKSLSSARDFHLLTVLSDLLEQIREVPQAPVAFMATASHPSDIHPSLTAFTGDQDFPLHVVRVQPLSEKERRLIFCDLFGATHKLADIEPLVSRTPGYVAVDMARLLSEARRILRSRNDGSVLQLTDVLSALPKVRPLLLGSDNTQWRFLSAGSVAEQPLFGLRRAQELLRQCLHAVFSQGSAANYGEASARQALAALGHCRGIVLHGESGTGKSALLRRAVSMMPQGTVNVMRVDSTDVVSSVIGEAERLVVQLFAAARSAAPTLLLIENLHILAPRRSDAEISARSDGGSASKAFERLLSTFLVELDGVRRETAPEKQILLVSTTSSLDLVDPAMLRPGRFELHIETELPNVEERRQVFEYAFSSMVPEDSREELLADLDLIQSLSLATEGWNVADVFALIREALFNILRDGCITTSESAWKEALTPSRITVELNKYLETRLK